MKDILLKFYGLGYKNYNQAKVKIYDNNNLVFDGMTYNSELSLYLEKYKVYRIIAEANGLLLATSFYVGEQKIYLFSFNIIKTITFILTDSNYQNLRIERGELLLWQR